MSERFRNFIYFKMYVTDAERDEIMTPWFLVSLLAFAGALLAIVMYFSHGKS